MQFVLHPWHLAFLILAGRVNRQQQDVINHLRIENQVLKEKLGKTRILLNDDQRRRLAVSGKALGRKLLEEVCTLFTPDTILPLDEAIRQEPGRSLRWLPVPTEILASQRVQVQNVKALLG